LTEEEFREHLIKFLRTQEGDTFDDMVVMHFQVMVEARSIKEENTTYSAYYANESMPLAYQLGTVEYRATRIRKYITED
jgi:hypothetical protein